MFTNYLNTKNQPDKLREKLNIPLGTHISIHQLDLLVDHFKCDVKVTVLNNIHVKFYHIKYICHISF